MSFGGATPTIVLLKGGDTSQGRGQLISNINACLAVQDTLCTTVSQIETFYMKNANLTNTFIAWASRC